MRDKARETRVFLYTLRLQDLDLDLALVIRVLRLIIRPYFRIDSFFTIVIVNRFVAGRKLGRSNKFCMGSRETRVFLYTLRLQDLDLDLALVIRVIRLIIRPFFQDR